MSDLRREALRYMGVAAADGALLALADEGFAQLSTAPPRHVKVALPVQIVLDAFGSQSLAAHLTGCDTAVLLAATLGTEADCLIRRAEATDTLRAMALHACAAALIEDYCDRVQAAVPGALRPRFSPGYGDFPLAAQRKLLDLADAGRRIGLFLTDGCMLVPAKSVTAVLGIGPALDCPDDKCARCEKTDCAFRGENTPCV